MKIKANDYHANEVIKIIREWLDKTQKEFGKEINRSKNAIWKEVIKSAKLPKLTIDYTF